MTGNRDHDCNLVDFDSSTTAFAKYSITAPERFDRFENWILKIPKGIIEFYEIISLFSNQFPPLQEWRVDTLTSIKTNLTSTFNLESIIIHRDAPN